MSELFEQQFRLIVNDYAEGRDNLISAIEYSESLRGDHAQLKVTFLNAMVVSITALTEETIRNIFKCYLQIVQDNHRSHKRLKLELQKSNFDAYLSVLKRHKDPAKFSDAHQLATNLQGCLGEAAGFSLRIEELTYNEGNCRTAQITDLAKKVGVRDLLLKVCDSERITDWCGETDLNRRVTVFTTRWNEIFDERDLVVHQMSNATGWGATKLVSAIEQVNILIDRISEVLLSDAITQLELENLRNERAQ